ncbi:bifunctional DNA-formamidopyrimidine glycosylase/DNA-(apurinic or apyrimidinic site) lyase [Rhabdochromatium marinum]|uniref:bifunctional DNA-formamidopyrimidine glycosylase/DNA-(apurinic or apyrimidinic site) lyase n=1 Tax=Rhabdochromatium marinum TaxID=48729 RepID=UPI00190309C3|nr:bifunctional DNA-formamidopyrimidine glycosylase/DNA-(apurinic or apyrimidinic site) lyase [Rhabdochromatium marinum]MBK1648172.1 DNA-formamidopyrimidine glycosylase [Rhabdochromatium marinum]
MPELPEVETTLRGIAPALTGQRIQRLLVRDRRLRQPVSNETEALLPGQRILHLHRRAKYLLLTLEEGAVLIHLGMSGSLRLTPVITDYRKHDHIDLLLESGLSLRLHDPRRFGLFQWIPTPVTSHPLLANLGPEPLSEACDGDYLYRVARKRHLAVKNLIMDSRVLVGVGNIYANEALFLSGIHPAQAAGSISQARYQRLAIAIKQVLSAAIEQGGTTLRDFLREDGHPGYFAQSLHVYNRADKPCHQCATPIEVLRIGQRSSFYCPVCQSETTPDCLPGARTGMSEP